MTRSFYPERPALVFLCDGSGGSINLFLADFILTITNADLQNEGIYEQIVH